MAPWGDKDRDGQGGNIEYVFSVRESKVAYTDYNSGNTPLLILEGEKEFTNGKVLDDHMWIGASGDKWQPNADGTAFEAVSGDEDERFDRRSKIQIFINSAVKAGVPLEERGDSALDATMWAGLKLRICEEEKSFIAKDTKEERTFSQPMVTEFLGEVDGAAAAPKKGAAKAAAPASNGTGDGDQLAKAKEIAQAVGPDNLIEYMDKVSRELGVGLDHTLCQEATYNSLLKA